MEKGELRLGSLFDGSGGFPLAGMLCGIMPVWASEIEPFPIRVTTKRLPFMRHLGDISAIRGSEIEPVDIITFGSPCQDMSLAGRRKGLDGERSCLFHEAVRIIREMREATGNRYPRYLIWENVPGAFSSNRGSDFRAVIQEIVDVRYNGQVHVPQPEKWNSSGLVVEDGFSLAWRVFDAQYWGVPQRRKRIYLVADLAGSSAGKVLFESEGLPGNPQESIFKRKDAAGCSETGTGTAGGLRMIENHPADSRIRISSDGKCQTLTGRMGTGGGNVPMLLKIRCGCDGGGKGPLVQRDRSATISCNNDQTLFEPKVFGIGSYDSEGMKSDNPIAGIYEAGTSRTIDGNGGNPSCRQGGMAVTEVRYCTSKASFFTNAVKEKAGSLVATDYKDPPIVTDTGGAEYIVRRLTPTECARLQGFPDWWCSGLGDDNPSVAEISWWREVFMTHARVTGKSMKQKTDNQIVKWLRNPRTDSAEYRMWGNGIALPCAAQVLFGIAFFAGLNS